MDRAGRRRRAGRRSRATAGIQEIPGENGDNHQREKEPEPAKSAALSLDSNFGHPFLPFRRCQSTVARSATRLECKLDAMRRGKRPFLSHAPLSTKLPSPTPPRMP